MAMIFTIDLIEGNSHIGVPVFSNSAKKENKNYMVFSQPRAPKKIEESEDERDIQEQANDQKKQVASGTKDFKSVDRLQIMQRIKDLEKQQNALVEGQNATSPRVNQSMENLKLKTKAQQMSSTKNNFMSSKVKSPVINKTNLMNQTAFNFGSSFKPQNQSPNNGILESYAFSSISRDHYYDVHGEKSEMPKNGSYHPRFSLVEKRVQGPVYAKRKALRMAQEARQRVEKHRIDQFEKDQLCTKIFRLLEQQAVRAVQTTGGYSNLRDRNKLNTQDTQRHPESQIESGHGNQNIIDGEDHINGSTHQPAFSLSPGNPNDPNHPLNLNKSAATMLAQQTNRSQGGEQFSKGLQHIQTQNPLSSSVNYAENLSSGMSQTARGFGEMRFSFSNQPLTTKYSLVNTYPEKRIIKDEIPKLPEQVTHRVISTEFFKRPKRPSFVNALGAPHELRLNPPQTVTNFNTIKQITFKGQKALDIGKVSDRDEDLILKAGDKDRDLTGHIANIYNPNMDFIHPPTSKQIMDFKKINPRSVHGSIYRKPCDQSPDFYDTKKVSKGFNLLANIVHPKSLVEIGKQHKRDLSYHVRHNNEALRNIERENQRQDFIKRLLTDQISN